MADEKKTTNTIETAKFLQIARERGLNVLEQKGFYKITGAVERRALYVEKNKTAKAGRVDVSGFESPAAITHTKPPTSRVKQMLSFDFPEETVLRNFAAVITDLVAVPKTVEQAGVSTNAPVAEQSAPAAETASAETEQVTETLTDPIDESGEEQEEPVAANG